MVVFAFICVEEIYWVIHIMGELIRVNNICLIEVKWSCNEKQNKFVFNYPDGLEVSSNISLIE